MRAGRLVKLTKCSAFKIGLVLGPSRVAGKLRVMTYSHQARGWSNPHTVLETDTAVVVLAVLPEHHRRTARHALEDGAQHGYIGETWHHVNLARQTIPAVRDAARAWIAAAINARRSKETP